MLHLDLRARGLFAALASALALAPRAAAPAASPLAQLDAIYPSLDALYQDLHRTPELSLQEEKTAAARSRAGS